MGGQQNIFDLRSDHGRTFASFYTALNIYAIENSYGANSLFGLFIFVSYNIQVRSVLARKYKTSF